MLRAFCTRFRARADHYPRTRMYMRAHAHTLYTHTHTHTHTHTSGKDSDALMESGATVSFYSENVAKTFMVGRDGYVVGINWFVFYIDGDTKEALPCDSVNCPTSLCAGGGWRKKQGSEYLC